MKKKSISFFLVLCLLLSLLPTTATAYSTEKTVTSGGVTVSYTSEGTASFTSIGTWSYAGLTGAPVYLLTLPSDAEISGVSVANPDPDEYDEEDRITLNFSVAGKTGTMAQFGVSDTYPTKAAIEAEVGLVSGSEFTEGADSQGNGYVYNLSLMEAATIANIPSTDVEGYMVAAPMKYGFKTIASPGIIVQYEAKNSGPITIYLDTSALAEAIQLNNNIYPPANEADYTVASWVAYRAVMDEAEAFLAEAAGLVDTPENRATLEAYVEAVKALLTNHVVDYKLSSLGVSAGSRLSDAQMAYTGLKNLCNILFSQKALTETDYSEDSWDEYYNAYEDAQAFLNSHDGTTLTLESGVNEAQSYVDAYQAFWEACYGLSGASDTITVTLDVTDTFARIKEMDHLAGGSYVLSLPAGATLEDAAQAAGIDLNALSNWVTYASIKLGVYVNGIYTQYAIVQESFPSARRTDISLNDGDHILIARMDAPMATSSSGAGSDAAGLGEVGSYIRYAEFVQDGNELTSFEATAGEDFALGAETIDADTFNALPTHYNGRVVPLAGAEIYRSEAYATEAEARAAAADIATGVVTGLDGTFSLELYSAEDSDSGEGWYLLNILSGDVNPGLTNAPNLLVHVTDPDDLSDVRTQLRSQLDEVYNAYSNDFYTESQLAEVQEYYEAGCAALADESASSGDLYAAYETAYEGIRAIQEQCEEWLNTYLADVETCLAWLPTQDALNEGRIYQADMIFLEALFGEEGIYSVRMSDYQKNQMNQSDLRLIQDLQTIYNEVKAGTRVLAALPENEVTVQFLDSATGEIVDGAYFHQINFSLEKLTDTLQWNEELLVVEYSGGGSTTYLADGNPWPGSHIIGSEKLYKSYVFGVINAPGYVLDHIDAPLDEHYYVTDGTWEGETWYSTSESGLEGALCNFSAAFNTPRSDLEIKIFLKLDSPVEASRKNALAQLEAAYNGYTRSKYSDDNWNTLRQAYQDGVSRINSATSEDQIQLALSDALAAMAAVPQKTDNSNAIPGWGADDDFDAGTKVGSVTITVENTTFPGGAFTDTILNRPDYAIGENDNMMTVILRALADAGYSWEGTGGSTKDGFDISYLAKIKKDGQEMGEFSGDPGSGWMGTLNDFMVNEGLNMFSVSSGQLGDGDVIALVYTQNLGVDLGGSWGNSDTTLKSLDVSTGTLIPGFASGEAGSSYDFALLIPGSIAGIQVTPHAANINFMVKTFLNEKVTTDAVGNSYYRRSETITVRPGDVIYVGCGERAWPSMNKQGDEASAYTGTWYALHVISTNDGADYVNELIAKLPAGNKITLSNYKNVLEQIAVIDQVKAALSSSEQAKVNTSTLEAARERAESFKAVDEVKALLAALPKSSNLSDSEVVAARRQIEAADAAYKALTDEQKGYITVGDVANYNALVERLAKLVPDTTAETITGSTATGDEVTVSAEEIKEAADENGSLAVETENGTVKLDAATLDALAETGEDVVVSVTENEDGTVTVDVTVDGETIDADVKVELPATGEGQVLVIVNPDGTEEIIKKSLVEDGTVYAELPAGATVKVIDNALHFIDVADNAWYADEVEFASSHGLFQGVGNNKFAPAAPMTRAMLATVLYRLEDAAATGANPFADVADGTWYTDAVIWASAEGIVQGTGKGFEPNENITREQIATMLYRYAKTIGLDVSGSAALDKFSDGDKTSSWAKDAMQWAVSVGLFQGDDVGTLRPQGDATRAEVAALLMRMVKLIVK